MNVCKCRTRMHRSRMRTIRCNGRLGGGVCLGGVCQGEKRGVCQGGVCPGGVYTSTLWIELLIHACENISFIIESYLTVLCQVLLRAKLFLTNEYLYHQDSEHHNKRLTTQKGLRPSQHLLVLPSVQSA